MMNRKFITSLSICFCALMAIVGSSYYVKNSADNEIKLEAESGENQLKEAGNEVKKEDEVSLEDQTLGDRVSDVEEQASSFTGNMVDVGNGTMSNESLSDEDVSDEETEDITEEQTTVKVVTENSERGDESLGGLSSEANAMIRNLDFGVNSEMLWPVEGNILLEYNMDNTIYFPTLNQYKTNPALIIQTEEYAPVIASTKGVVTEIGEDNEIGVYVKMSIGNDYEVTYGQVINPTVQVGEIVEEGTTIACVNEPTRYYEKEGYNLYMAVTKAGEPVDPMEFLNYGE